MINGKKVLGIIPARGGSKGLPGKNIKELLGKPLIAWSIEAGKQSAHIDALIVSTDDEKIAEVSRKFGAEVPFLRPPEFASDTATSVDVIAHAVDFMQARGEHFDMIVLLEPTSPLREAQDIDAALELMADGSASAVVSVCEAESTHPAFMFRMESGGHIKTMQSTGFKVLRRQELDPAFFLDGSVYVSDIQTLLSQKTFCHDGTKGLTVPKWKAPEIDDIVDFLVVEAILKHRRENQE